VPSHAGKTLKCVIGKTHRKCKPSRDRGVYRVVERACGPRSVIVDHVERLRCGWTRPAARRLVPERIERILDSTRTAIERRTSEGGPDVRGEPVVRNRPIGAIAVVAVNIVVDHVDWHGYALIAGGSYPPVLRV
jgi:hypothetical protein